jgi:hypothetical protein
MVFLEETATPIICHHLYFTMLDPASDVFKSQKCLKRYQIFSIPKFSRVQIIRDKRVYFQSIQLGTVDLKYHLEINKHYGNMCTKERPYAAETIGKPSQWQTKSDCSSIIHMHLSDMEKLFFVTFTVSRTVKSCPTTHYAGTKGCKVL